MALLPQSTFASSGAVLGGDSASFDAQLGPANDHSDSTLRHYQRCPGSNVDQFITMSLSGAVIMVLRQPCGARATAQRNLAEAANFLPDDAVAGDAFVDETGEPARQYFSPALADAVAADLFHDCDGAPVAPGTFSVVLTSNGGWTSAIGTCP